MKKTRKEALKMTSKERKPYGLNEAIELLDSKRGAGVSKNLRIKMDIEFKGSITLASSILSIFKSFINMVISNADITDNFNIEVITEFEDNEDWEK